MAPHIGKHYFGPRKFSAQFLRTRPPQYYEILGPKLPPVKIFDEQPSDRKTPGSGRSSQRKGGGKGQQTAQTDPALKGDPFGRTPAAPSGGEP